MSTRADQIIAALRSGHNDLSTFVRGLSEEDLGRQSGASEWQVSRVLSHLGSGAEIWLSALRDAQTGGPGPDLESNRKVWARWDAMSPVEQADGFLESNERLVAACESLDASSRDGLRINLGFLPEPVDVATAALFRLGEFGPHRWDVEVAFDPAAALAPDAVPLLLDQTRTMLAWLAKPERLGGTRAVLALRLTQPDASYGLDLGERIALTEAPQSPDGEFSAPAEAWIRLVYGRLGPEHTPAGVRVTGPVSLEDLRRAFPGF